MGVEWAGQSRRRRPRRRWAAQRALLHSRSWGSLLDQLPTLYEGGHADLRVDEPGVRVWLSRCGIEDGEPFARTVHVECTDADGCRYGVGYFDADEPDPQPTGELRDGLAATRLAVAMHLLGQQR